MLMCPLTLLLADIIPYRQEIKRERSDHLISPDMVTKETFSARRGRRAAAGFLSVLTHDYRSIMAWMAIWPLPVLNMESLNHDYRSIMAWMAIRPLPVLNMESLYHDYHNLQGIFIII